MVNWFWALVMVIIIQRIFELHIANKNRIWALTQGAQEFGRRHYPLFFALHIGWLIGWIIEGHLGRGQVSEFWHVWLSAFVLAQGLRYWCMISLGRSWNTRIIVIPGQFLIRKGPYRFLSHPNYLAVAVELISVPLLFGATTTAMSATLLNAVLILAIRIPEERQALQSNLRHPFL